MSVEITGQTTTLDITSSFGIATDETVFVSVWSKWLSATGSHNSANILFDMDSTSASYEMRANAGPKIIHGYNTGSGQLNRTHSTNFTDDEWEHFAAGWGPADGSSHNNPIWFDGAKVVGSAGATDNINPAENFTTLRLGQAIGSSSNFTWWKGRIAYLAMWNGLTELQMDTLVAELQTTPPDDATITPDIAWSLASNGNATTGSGNFTNNGATFVSGDNPSLGGGASSPSSIIIL